jgi:U3 small nucleolar RNA-associated protein 4
VRIWRVKPQDDGTEKPKVVARLALQGEENIISVSISRDGGLLAVATASTVKLFQLLQPQAGVGAGLRIRKLDMPSIAGAKTVKLATTGKWLAAVTAADEIQLVRIVRTEDPTDAPRALEKVQPLYRLDRNTTTQSPLSSSSGSYESSIVLAEFSKDGNVFAVVDLAGYVDTWVTEGHEDSTAPEIDIDDSAAAVKEGDDSEDEEEANEQITFLGQHWIRNPSAHLLPRLESTPVLLSFQPSSDTDRPESNGNPAVHPTRHNPHPRSHELPSADYRLLLVSAEHQLYIFDVMSGRLSEWSRRNPQSSYPREYKQLDLPAKGCIWDVAESQQRIWLYGEKWLFMFDLTKDFPTLDAEHAGKKRKRDAFKNNSGAGDAVPAKEAPVIKLRKFQSNDDAGRQKWIDINATGRNPADDDDDEDSAQALSSLRRSNTQDSEHVNGESEDPVNGGGVVEEVETQKKSESSWHTFKYRPILGIVPISGDDRFSAPEVVLVERPSWDLGLTERFVGTHEQ